VLKKLFFIISIVFISITPSFADIGPFTIDLFGAYIDAGDLESQVGFGGGFGLGITDTLNVQFRVISTEKSTEDDLNTLAENEESSYEHFTMQAGVEYVPVIPFLEKYQLSWNTSIFLGMADSGYRYYKGWNEYENYENGYSLSIWTGPHFNLTQYVSFFAEIGYHFCYYTGEMEDTNVSGFQALIGARCTLFGARDYAEGY